MEFFQRFPARLGWKASRPDEYKLLFHCGTRLVDTFKKLYRDMLEFEGNRAIVLHETVELPVTPLKHCISLALTYHRRKKLPGVTRQVAAIAYASRAIGRRHDLPLRRILSSRKAAWDRDMAVVPSFDTHIHPTPARRFERPADEPSDSPFRRG